MGTMLVWNERPVEIANLFNPAFCALLLRQAATSYHKKSGKGLDYPVAFLILPLLLHGSSRELLPKTAGTNIHTWIQEHEEIKIGLDQRISNLYNYTRESVILALQHEILFIDELGALNPSKRRLPRFEENNSEATLCVKKATMIGKWFGSAGSTATLLSMWGIRL